MSRGSGKSQRGRWGNPSLAQEAALERQKYWETAQLCSQ